MKTIFDLLKEHTFFEELDENYIKIIAECGQNIHSSPGQYLAREGAPADSFYILRKGNAHVEINAAPYGTKLIHSLSAGDIAGWSWIFPPYTWRFDIKVTSSLSAIALDAACLRKKCESDHTLGYQLMKKFAYIMTNRLKETRVQLLDIYGK